MKVSSWWGREAGKKKKGGYEFFWMSIERAE
jgi:hypothetical protein